MPQGHLERVPKAGGVPLSSVVECNHGGTTWPWLVSRSSGREENVWDAPHVSEKAEEVTLGLRKEAA